MNKRRLSWLDMARGIGILLVVTGHVWDRENAATTILYSFHVPLFFIISGILMRYTRQEQRSMKQLTAARVHSLLIPYFFYEAVFVLLWGILNHFDYSAQGHAPWDSLRMDPVNTPIWFLAVAFFAELILLALIRLFSRIPGQRDSSLFEDNGLQSLSDPRFSSLIAVCVILYLVPFVVPSGTWADPLLRICCAVGFLAFGYFGCGWLLLPLSVPRQFRPGAQWADARGAAAGTAADSPTAKSEADPASELSGEENASSFTLSEVPARILFLAAAAVGFAVTVHLSLQNGLCGIYKLVFREPICFTICAVLGSLSVLLLCRSLPEPAARIGARVGQNTLPILGLHIFILRLLQAVLKIPADNGWQVLLYVILIGICFLPVCFIINRWFPWAAGKKLKS